MTIFRRKGVLQDWHRIIRTALKIVGNYRIICDWKETGEAIQQDILGSIPKSLIASIDRKYGEIKLELTNGSRLYIHDHEYDHLPFPEMLDKNNE